MNSKVKNKSFVLSFVLAILLALSLLLNFSGAWFTDSATSEGGGTTITFGTVKLGSDTIDVNVPNPLLPSQSITFNQIEYVGNVNAYYQIFFDVAEYNGANPTLDDLKATLKANTVQYGLFTVATDAGKKVTPNAVDISQAVGNNYQTISCKFSVTIQVIQQANIPGVANPNNPTQAEYAQIFANYYSDTGN